MLYIFAVIEYDLRNDHLLYYDHVSYCILFSNGLYYMILTLNLLVRCIESSVGHLKINSPIEKIVYFKGRPS